jgi:hypothetical protein
MPNPACCTRASRGAWPPPSRGLRGRLGYAELLGAIADPDHERRAEMTEWIGDDFDPEADDAKVKAKAKAKAKALVAAVTALANRGHGNLRINALKSSIHRLHRMITVGNSVHARRRSPPFGNGRLLCLHFQRFYCSLEVML